MELFLDEKLFAGTEEEFLAIEKFHSKEWRLNGNLHRIDGPAVIYSSGHQEWYQNGEWHRIDGPAIIWKDGSEFWYQNDLRHRTDGPAVINSGGYQVYVFRGLTLMHLFPINNSLKIRARDLFCAA